MSTKRLHCSCCGYGYLGTQDAQHDKGFGTCDSCKAHIHQVSIQMVIKQVTELSDGTIASCIRQGQRDFLLWTELDSTCYAVIDTLRKNIINHTIKNAQPDWNWVDATLSFMKTSKLNS